MYCFVILVLTGSYLTFFFNASEQEVVYHGSYKPLQGIQMSEAYRSVLDISFQVRAGLVMRQIHHWAAVVFLAAIVVHLCRIFFTGAFRRPREINWIVGVTLLLLAMGNGFTGYSLPDDLLSGTGLRIAYSIVLSIPFIGVWIGLVALRRQVPGHGDHPPAVHHPRLLHPGRHRGRARRASRHPLAPKAHRLRRTGQDRAHHHREPAVAPVHGQVHRSVLLRAGRAGRPRRPGPDQPDLAVRPLPAGGGQRRLATRLVHRVARRRPAGLSQPRDPRLRAHRRQSVLPRCAHAGHHLRAVVCVAVPRAALHQGPRPAPPARPAAGPPGAHRARGGDHHLLHRPVPGRGHRRAGQHVLPVVRDGAPGLPGRRSSCCRSSAGGSPGGSARSCPGSG